MAQKATKTLASKNTTRLNQTLYATLIVHTLFWFLRFLLFGSSFHRSSLIKYILFSAPQLLIQFQFERLSRPSYNADGSVRRGGEDLEAQGLTEYLWDVTYWTYGCVLATAVLGDWAWWFYLVVPAYSGWLAWTTFVGVRQGLRPDAAGVEQPVGAASKRQAKLEKRGQRVAYR